MTPNDGDFSPDSKDWVWSTEADDWVLSPEWFRLNPVSLAAPPVSSGPDPTAEPDAEPSPPWGWITAGFFACLIFGAIAGGWMEHNHQTYSRVFDSPDPVVITIDCNQPGPNGADHPACQETP